MQSEILKTLIAILIPCVTGIFGFIIGYLNYMRMKAKVKEDITLELMRNRIDSYNEFLKSLKSLSSYGNEYNDEEYRKRLADAKEIIKDALYNRVGMLASHDTRQFLRLARLGIDKYLRGEIEKTHLHNVIWALHFTLRSDLGIKQPNWDSEIDVIRKKKGMSAQQEALSQLLQSDYWDFISIDPIFDRWLQAGKAGGSGSRTQ